MKTKLIAFMIACHGMIAAAQTNHTSLHVAIETAVNNVLPCAKIDIKRTQLYTVTGGTITGMAWQAVCLKLVSISTPPTGHTLIKLSWAIPTQRENGTPLALSEIAGYTIIYVRDGGEPVQVQVNDGAATTHTFTVLPPGTYSFYIAAIDIDGNNSERSAVVEVHHE